MHNTFLYIDLFLLFIPLLLSLDRKAKVLSNLKSILIASLLVMLVFSEVAIFLTGVKAWNFNEAYIIGVDYRGLPLEAYLFLFLFSFAGLGIYNYLNSRFPKNELQKYALAVSHALMGVCIAMLFFAYTKWFPLITFAFLMMLLIGVEYINTLRFMYKFYRAFVFALIPFFVCYGVICSFPIITYDAKESLDFSLATIPFENYFLMMGTLLLGVYFMEVLNRKFAK